MLASAHTSLLNVSQKEKYEHFLDCFEAEANALKPTKDEHDKLNADREIQREEFRKQLKVELNQKRQDVLDERGEWHFGLHN